ncbi:polysaccharide deacetylase family protein [Lichenifustis flavocetrariae]|uniref:Chitooligosaccharide deacetylase n=1 Tax=Lichenifustis flavocetrariae TaxID=2949735 RepID=A0AA41Z0V1_9HYPH|nr:polysaccharide deacetylase family protein [Lichenifustis flavocetrariae]MCW6511679.1 polysaccharide deacetylase family protein [Lichenifustis flavocetrariae]
MPEQGPAVSLATGESARDIVGYGASPPHPHWPGGARVAVNFVINYEEGAEYTLLNGDDRPETILSEVGASAPLPGTRDRIMESMYEYGSRAGVWRVLDAFRLRGVVPTCYAVGLAFEQNPHAAEAFAALGCDFAGHGWRWIDYAAVPEPVERDHIERCAATIRSLTGRAPAGWYTGRPSANTRRLAVEHGGFLYDSDAYNDDLPFWMPVGGRSHLVVPHAFDTNDSRMARNQDLAAPDAFFTYLRDSFDVLYDEGERAPKMMTVSLHCRLIGRPGRIRALARFLDHVLAHDRVWVCRREDLARHWMAHVPAAGPAGSTTARRLHVDGSSGSHETVGPGRG